MIGVEKTILKTRNHSNKLKSIGKCCDSNPYLELQDLVVLHTVPWEPLEFLTKVSEIIKIYDTTEIRTRNYCLRIFFPNRTAEIYFLMKRDGKKTVKKNDPIEKIIFLTYFKNMGEK